jgi:hypothetical protein
MNERLKQLAEQAGFEFNSLGGTYTSGTLIDNLDKFAELIIRECANVAMQADIDGCNIGNRAWQKINEHFGVE